MRDLSRFDHVIVGDDGSRGIRQEANRYDADPVRLTEAEIESLEEWDRVVTRTAAGEKIIIEMIPDDPEIPAPIEIRDCDEGDEFAQIMDEICDPEENCAACGVNPRASESRYCASCHEALVEGEP